MLGDVVLLMVLVFVGLWFWQLRQMAEASERHAKRACNSQNLQLLAVALQRARPAFGGNSGLSWRGSYLFEFSTDGVNRLQATMTLHGQTLLGIDWPVFPEPEWQHAPESKRRSCCG